MKKLSCKHITAIALIAVIGSGVFWYTRASQSKPADKPTSGDQVKAALNVTTIKAENSDWPTSLTANGSVAAWQEAVVGSELSGLQLAEVRVNVGDVVHRGQVLARFDSDSVAAQLAQQKAALEEARAALFEAQSNVERAQTLANSGALSAQQTTQYAVAERSAKARVLNAQATLDMQQIRMRQTQVLAPDDGVISSRTATVGAVTNSGQELFKLIRKNRLEWRAEVNASDLLRIQPGQAVKLTITNGLTVDGKVRMIAPTVDSATRNGLVYVDLPAPGAVHAGMFGTGEFEIGSAEGLSLPQAAVVIRDGYSYVYQIGKDNKVTQIKVSLGRRVGNRIEVTNGINENMALVAQGAGFLADGDTVNVVAAPTAPASSAVTSPAKTHSASAKVAGTSTLASK
ncbi:efflux RND transporter periplasmic adaptor subunit [Glaciimonas soli]|uniref:Efflux RND transporter periplasmic adaptor subunit n=1 Tax=Glaciimonas soli TaxID=2590999 RepID=A0A843YR73_9BURK|nr:efflux RND transporter periplasmic adaptor subunit [Glaciimonas soli]MQR01610.1 efflux RND transporter periplasmic adaptor subunit [Glaciimonas soli]